MNIISIFADVVKPIKLRGTGTFHPHETGIINEHISCIRQKDVSFWFYKKNNTVIAIDSGYNTEKKFFEDLDKLSINNEKIKAVLLTHGDVDHMGGLLAQNRFAPNAEIYINEIEEPMILGKAFRFCKGFIKIKNPVRFKGEYRLFKDREVIQIDEITIEVFNCPGHTKGHTAFLIDKKWLFMGDSIAVNEYGGYSFFNFYNMDTKENIDSLKKLKEIFSETNIDLVFTNHNGICDFQHAFSQITQVAKSSKRKPFDKTAPFDVFKEQS